MTTWPDYIYHKEDLMKGFEEMLNQLWPLQPTRTISLKLQTLRMKTDEDHKIALCKSKKLDTFVTASGGG